MEPKKVEQAIVIFDSMHGNTGQVAKSLADGLRKAGMETSCLNWRDVKTETLSSYDLIAVGAPTQAFSASKPMKDFLGQLENISELKGKHGFAFDTRFASRLSGSAAKYIESKLSKLGLEIVKPRESAIVKKTEGPLAEGELETFERLGFDIGSNLIGKK